MDLSQKYCTGVHINMNPKIVQKRKAPITAIVIQHALTNRGCGNRRRYNRRIETLVRNKAIEYAGTLTQNGCSSKSAACKLRG
jgi:hypothetical protein